jgi:UDP-N-acetyl-D-mannosaminuronic acid dehydrogenase
VIAESVEAAEFIKLMSNTYRDVNFAFSNEMAKIAEPWKINSQEAIRLANYKYPRCNIQNPGLTGGPCLEKDPRILASSAFKVGIDTPITNSGRDTNETLPLHFIKNIHENFPDIKFTKFGILGLAFKGRPATSDTRGSLSFGLRDAIISNFPGASVFGYDDLIRSNSPKLEKISVIANLEDFVNCVEIIVIQNNNNKMIRDFTDLILVLAPDKPIYDFWNVFSDDHLTTLSNTKSFGRG